MIRHVVFDFDGTLVRSNRIKRQAFYDAAAGLDGAAEILDALFAGGFDGDRFAVVEALARRLAERGVTVEPEALAADYTRRCRAGVAAAPEVPGAAAALERLAGADVRLYLVSATPQQALEEVVADRRLDRTFARILGAPPTKPVHLRALVEAGVPVGELALVGDGRDDQAAAEQVGCRFVAVDDQPKERLDAEVFVRDLRDLPAALGLARS
ncbi:MAG TPA: HAD family hydrolase [Thermohalobaculum sp.]|nr:HAD family hydrolase [Thermohalobaculum sp.]